METKKKARPDAVTPERAGGENSGCYALQNPHNDFTPMTARIQGLLREGVGNAISLRDLVTLTGMDARTVRAMIANERLAGAPILSDNLHGYFLPGGEEERVKFVESMRHRAMQILRAAEAVEKGRR